MRVYGNSAIHAPNLNKLASESTVFRNAYVSQPVCTPSRSTVLTGLWPHMNSCVENNIPLPDDVQCLPEIIDDPDYRTAYYGKWHLGDEVFAQHGFEEWESIEDMYRRFYRETLDQSSRSGYHHYLTDLGYTPDSDNNQFSRGFAARLPLEHCKPKFLEQNACDFLRRNCDNPFILSINFLEPHMPFYGPLDNEHSLDEIVLPGNFDDPLEDNEPLRYRLLRENYRQKGFEGNDLDSVSGWRRLIANYWGLVTQVDMSVGVILTVLEELGIADNTLVVYTSDHGDMMGSHRLLAKTVMYEESVKVPWLMRIPGFGRKQQVIENPVSHIDLIPTILDLMGVRHDKAFPGQSLVPLIQGNSVEEDHVFIQWNPAVIRGRTPHSIPDVSGDDVQRVHGAYTRTIISPDGWKLCLSDNDTSQLFDLNSDPLETTNLFDLNCYRDTVTILTEKILRWQRKTRDDANVLT